MKILFVSRKKASDIGGLSRFTQELTAHFPRPHFLLTFSLTSPISLFPQIPLISHIHLCDATLLHLGVFLKLILQKPLTLTIHGLDITYNNKLYQLMLKMLLPKADAVIADSQATKHLLSSFHLKQQVLVIPPGITVEHLNASNLSNSPNLPNLKNKLILLTVGNLVFRKGHVWFLRKVFRKLSKKFVYLIVGEGPERANIERTIRRLHLGHPRGGRSLPPQVFLTGRLTDAQLGFLYKQADIYICPNQHIEGDFEGFGLAAGEAALMGLPVVASNVDGIGEIIKDGKNGILIKPEPKAFIQAICRFKNPILRKKIGQKAKIYTKNHYNWQKTVKKYLKVFESVIPAKAGIQ